MRKFLSLLIVLCLAVTAQAQSDTLVTDSVPWAQRLRLRIDSILATPLLETSQLGLLIYDMTADSTLYAYGHRQTLRPASTMKLLTAITALEQLPADYQLTTTLSYTGRIDRGTLVGNLWCRGGMDPLFGTDDMRYFVSSLRQLGVDTIRGRVLADMSFKEDVDFGEGWCWDDDNSVLSPLLVERKDNFAETLGRELRRGGVVVIDSVVSLGVNVKTVQRIRVCSRSHTVDELLMPMMKESDNLYAEALFYHIAANVSRPAKVKQAVSQVKKMIQKVALAPGDYRVADGSGLSLYNYVSAELETRLLRYAWKRPQLFGRLYNTLPIAGVDGTLKKRMMKGAATGNVHAKTGTVSGVSSLAGYCSAANGHELCFAIINQGIMRMADGRGLQDQLCEAMCR